MKAQSLSQRLNLAVVGITLATLILSLIFIAFAYGLLFQFAPKLVSAEDAILPAPVEWGMYSVCIVLGSIAAVTQLRFDTEGRVYYRRKRADGKKPMEAMRCLKRRISDVVYRQLVADA